MFATMRGLLCEFGSLNSVICACVVNTSLNEISPQPEKFV